jgi:hypothetical protein
MKERGEGRVERGFRRQEGTGRGCGFEISVSFGTAGEMVDAADD